MNWMYGFLSAQYGFHQLNTEDCTPFSFSLLLSSLEVSDTQVYEPSIRALLGTPTPPRSTQTEVGVLCVVVVGGARTQIKPYPLDRQPESVDRNRIHLIRHRIQFIDKKANPACFTFSLGGPQTVAPHESGSLRAVHLSRHKWPGGLVN